MSVNETVIVIGAGAAGYFGAIACSEANPTCDVILLEKNRQILSKVRISGGGRCNVTHACFDPAELIKNYPRGGKELRGPFARFQPRDTIQWFESRGVPLKVEEDGRMFPVSDSSESIISCLVEEAKACGVELRTNANVVDVVKNDEHFQLTLANGETLSCEYLLFASGALTKSLEWLERLGHVPVSPVPSLFTFNIPKSPLHHLAGVSVPKVKLTLDGFSKSMEGPLLVTHWGFSGPAVLKLSAWAARYLHEVDYRADVRINWLPDLTMKDIKETLSGYKLAHGAKQVAGSYPFDLPKNLWKAFLDQANVPHDRRYSALSNPEQSALISLLSSSIYSIQGKTTYKEEFVTCGGIRLEEVNFKTMESKKCPGLFFAGEVLDIDGVTGGFNFQNAWTTAYIAGQSIAGS